MSDILEQYGLVVRHIVQLEPEQFMAQRLLPSVAAIYCHPLSAPLAVAHRRINARTQSRVEILPGCCLLRGERARHDWTLAIPPLLERLSRRGEETTRTVSLLVDAEIEGNAGTDVDSDLTFEVHEPRTVA